MNQVLVTVIIIFGLNVFIGYHKGLMQIILSLVSTVAGIVLAFALTPMISDLTIEYTPIDDMVAIAIDRLGETEPIEEEVESLWPTAEEEVEEIPVDLPLQDQIVLIEGADMPEFLKETLLTNNNKEIYDQLGVENFGDYVVRYMVEWAIRCLVFVLLFVIISGLLRALVSYMDIISKLPVIRGLNKWGGAILGSGFSLIIIWIGFLLIALLYSTTFGSLCLEMIESNALLRLLYDTNVFMNMLL